jgi:hypothetical protein
MTDLEFFEHAKILKSDPHILLSSCPQFLINHPSFKAIVSDGRRVIPLILRDFEVDEMFSWDIVLEHIVGFCPCPVEHRGVVDKIRQDWLEWGRKRGFLTENMG